MLLLKDNSLKRYHIVYINVMDGYSGGEIVLQRLIRALDKQRFDVTVYTTRTKFVETLECPECKVVIMDRHFQLQKKRGIWATFQAIGNFWYAGKCSALIKFSEKADIVHSNSMISNLYFAFWTRIFFLKLIAHSHEIKEGLLFKLIHRYVGGCASQVIAVSNAVKSNWLGHGVNEQKITVVYNGLPDDFF